jgi:uncharacterized protein YacL (UPF0231 family)
MHNIFEAASKGAQVYILASKKIYFYAVWFNTEIKNNFDLVDEILRTLVVILGGVHDRYCKSEQQTPDPTIKLHL